jgi:hypothetical protein
MKFTALKHRVLAAHSHLAPAGTTIRVMGGPPPEAPPSAFGEPANAIKPSEGPDVPPAAESPPAGS